jgi:hypothetical protein
MTMGLGPWWVQLCSNISCFMPIMLNNWPFLPHLIVETKIVHHTAWPSNATVNYSPAQIPDSHPHQVHHDLICWPLTMCQVTPHSHRLFSHITLPFLIVLQDLVHCLIAHELHAHVILIPFSLFLSLSCKPEIWIQTWKIKSLLPQCLSTRVPSPLSSSKQRCQSLSDHGKW